VQYQVDDVRAWVYNHTDSGALLESLATREVVKYLVSVDVDDIMTMGRQKAAEELRSRIQKLATDQQMGAKILYVGLQGVHPPVKVADAYEAVIGSLSEKETNILAAQAYALETVPRAAAEAAAITNRAEGDRATRTASADALSSQFTNQIKAYQASPSVYMARAHMDTLGRVFQNSRKIINIATNTHDVILLNLEEKIDKSMLQLK
jgi:membrane protease subunit HflK